MPFTKTQSDIILFVSLSVLFYAFYIYVYFCIRLSASFLSSATEIKQVKFDVSYLYSDCLYYHPRSELGTPECTKCPCISQWFGFLYGIDSRSIELPLNSVVLLPCGQEATRWVREQLTEKAELGNWLNDR